MMMIVRRHWTASGAPSRRARSPGCRVVRLYAPTPRSKGARHDRRVRTAVNRRRGAVRPTSPDGNEPTPSWRAGPYRWSGIPDSNRCQKLGRLLCCHYTNPARQHPNSTPGRDGGQARTRTSAAPGGGGRRLRRTGGSPSRPASSGPAGASGPARRGRLGRGRAGVRMSRAGGRMGPFVPSRPKTLTRKGCDSLL